MKKYLGDLFLTESAVDIQTNYLYAVLKLCRMPILQALSLYEFHLSL